MKLIKFPAESYTLNDNQTFTYNQTEGSIIGIFELLWSAIQNSKIADLTKSDHRVLKSLKRKLREISVYKDSDKDSRILHLGPKNLLLETSEYNILIKCLDANNFIAKIAEEVDTLYTILESASDYTPPTPTPI